MYIYLFISNNNSKRFYKKITQKCIREYEIVFSKNHECSSGNRQKHYASYSVLKLLEKRSEGYTTAISRNPTFLNDTTCHCIH